MHDPRVTSRFSRFALVALLFLVAGLSGCRFLFSTPLASATGLLFYDEFRGFSDGDWDSGGDPEPGQNDMRPGKGYLVFTRPWLFIRTTSAWRGTMQIDVEWSVVREDGTLPAILPMDAGDDFRVGFDGAGVYAALELYDGGIDSLSIRNADGTLLAGPFSVPTGNATRGHLIVTYRPNGPDAGITAYVPGLGLVVSTELERFFGETRIELWVSGIYDGPRVLESIYVFEEPSS